jgi:hypothetical protein
MALDPGLKGGVCVCRDGLSFIAWPMPVVRYRYGSDRRRRGKVVENIDVVALHRLALDHGITEVVIEQQTAMPGQGAPSAGTTFTNYGLLLSLRLVAPVHVVHPATWKAKLKVPADKKEATQRCRELFPGSPTPDHDGPAEALMLALYWNGVRDNDTADQAERRRADAGGKAKAVRGGLPAGPPGARGADGAVADARPERLVARRRAAGLRGADGRLQPRGGP